MNKSELLEKWKDTMHHLNHESFESDLDALIKKEKIEIVRELLENNVHKHYTRILDLANDLGLWQSNSGRWLIDDEF